MGVSFRRRSVGQTIWIGVLGPALMGVYGEVIGLLFSLEGIAFFIGPIFLCI